MESASNPPPATIRLFAAVGSAQRRRQLGPSRRVVHRGFFRTKEVRRLLFCIFCNQDIHTHMRLQRRGAPVTKQR